jgi:hypothetical protein
VRHPRRQVLRRKCGGRRTTWDNYALSFCLLCCIINISLAAVPSVRITINLLPIIRLLTRKVFGLLWTTTLLSAATPPPFSVVIVKLLLHGGFFLGDEADHSKAARLCVLYISCPSSPDSLAEFGSVLCLTLSQNHLLLPWPELSNSS